MSCPSGGGPLSFGNMSERQSTVLPSTLPLSFCAQHCHSERPAKNLFRRPSKTASLDMDPVRRGVAGLTPLRTDDAIQSIYLRDRAQRRGSVDASAHKTTTLYEGISSSTFPFCLCKLRQRPLWQRPKEDGRYAPVTFNIRSRWHHRGAYLHKNVEICAAAPRYTLSTASSGSISPLASPVAADVEDQCDTPDPSLTLRMTRSRSG